ncbi:hypothetical protein GCM10009843_24290 [Nocardioides bigeumensis]|uniref:Uncharacterized protein n=1 Tax=Nocardioides bigeumensis TaxID=433657 RepID=A0ABP5K205_9ACTN
MSSVDEHDHPVGVELQEEPSRRRPLLLATAVVLVLVLVAWSAVWWDRTPPVLGGSFETRLDPTPVPGPVLVGITSPATVPGQANVSLVDVSPELTRNDADADVSFLVCELKGDPITAVVAEPIEDHCRRTRPAHDTTIRVAGEYLVMAITARERGTVRVESVDVTYRNGWQLVWLPRTVTVGISARARFS